MVFMTGLIRLIVISIKCASLIILVYLSHDLNSIAWRYDQLILRYSGYLGAFIFVAIWLISILGLFAASFHSNRVFRIIMTVLFFCSSAIGISFEKIAGSQINYGIVLTMMRNIAFAGDAANFYSTEIIYGIAVSLLVVTFLLPSYLFKKEFKVKKYLTTFMSLNAIIPSAIILALSILRSGHGLQSLPLQYKTMSLFSHVVLSDLVVQAPERQNIDIVLKHNKTMTNKPNIILIIDESVRGDYLDININQDITPYLFSQRCNIHNFGLAASGSNCSAESHQILRYGAVNNSTEDLIYTFNSNPYIWRFAKNAGYKTIYIEAQCAKGKIYNNGLTDEEIAFIDNSIYCSVKRKGLEGDLNAARYIKELINLADHESPFFVYVVKAGIHFPYDDNVPKERRLFKSSSQGHDIGNKEDLVNSYKNAIAYSIDPFFKMIIDGVDYSNTIAIYTSDHGQNLLDNNKTVSHCSEFPSIYEGLVPLFVITEHQSYKTKFSKATTVNKDRVSHFHIFPTILSLMGYENEFIRESYGRSLFEKEEEVRRFTSGYISSAILGFGSRSSVSFHPIPDDVIMEQDSCSPNAEKSY